jgi:hypothetical protein
MLPPSLSHAVGQASHTRFSVQAQRQHAWTQQARGAKHRWQANKPAGAAAHARVCKGGQNTRYLIPEPELPEPRPEVPEPEIPDHNFG